MPVDFNDYINLDEALKRVGGSKKLYKKLLGLYLISGEFAALDEAIALGDNTKAAEAAHTIKGLTGNLSLTKLFDSSVELMSMYRNGTAQPEAIEHFRKTAQNTREAVNLLLEQFAAEGIV